MKTKNLLLTGLTIFLLFTSSQSVKSQTGVYSPSLVNFDVAMTNLLNDFDIPGGQLAILKILSGQTAVLVDESAKPNPRL